MKYFISGDIHSYYDEFRAALNSAGFDKNNPNHFFIGLGDYFDRGNQALEVMKYLKELPRKCLCRGNHEILLLDIIERGFPYGYDYQNGTFNTVCDLSGAYENKSFNECCLKIEKMMKLWVNQMPNYFETEHYIFCHSFVPLCKDWRNANQNEWNEAVWCNPFKLAEKYKLGKTIVFGHYHSSFAWARNGKCSEFGGDAIFEPYYGDGYIGIDGCVAHTGKVNVLVLED